MQRFTLPLASGFLLLAAAAPAAANGDGFPACSATARTMQHACYADTRDDFLTQRANCLNRDDTQDCVAEAREEFIEARGECREVHTARLEVCDAVGEDRYQAPFGEDFADQFVDPLTIGQTTAANPYFPLVPGNYWIYEDDEGEETITVQVTDKTKLIDGVTCIVVMDTAEEDGVATEITDDWYAQDLQGNVYYCGEISQSLEVFEGDDPEEPELVEIGGSWKHGREGAQAGILLPITPMPGQTLRQEVAWGEAEDVIEILALDADESVTLGDDSELSCNNTCLQTRDFTALEPDANEHKYYLPGTGLLLEVDLEEGTRVELKEFGNNAP